MQKRLYAFTGLSKSGKTTAKKYITTTSNKLLLPMAFADEVKREVAETYDLDFYRLMEDYEYKALHRDALIEYGEARRKNDQFYWVNKIAQKIQKHWNSFDGFVIDDLGMLPEYFWAKGAGFVVTHLTRPGIELIANNTRDFELDNWMKENNKSYDLSLYNYGTLEEFYNSLNTMFNGKSLSLKTLAETYNNNPNFDANGYINV